MFYNKCTQKRKLDLVNFLSKLNPCNIKKINLCLKKFLDFKDCNIDSMLPKGVMGT